MKTREIIVLSRHQAFLRPGGSRTFSSYSITPVVRKTSTNEILYTYVKHLHHTIRYSNLRGAFH